MLQVGAPKKIIPRVHSPTPQFTQQRNHKPNKYFCTRKEDPSKVVQKGRIDKVLFPPLLYAVKFCVYMCVVGFDILVTPNPWSPPFFTMVPTSTRCPLQVLSKNRRVNMRTCMYDRWMILCNFGGDLFAPLVLYCIVLCCIDW